MARRTRARLPRRPTIRDALAVACVATVAAVAAIDAVSSTVLPPFPLYLVPIALAACGASLAVGAGLAFASGGAWLGANGLGGPGDDALVWFASSC